MSAGECQTTNRGDYDDVSHGVVVAAVVKFMCSEVSNNVVFFFVTLISQWICRKKRRTPHLRLMRVILLF
jgi:hypothetical protein